MGVYNNRDYYKHEFVVEYIYWKSNRWRISPTFSTWWPADAKSKTTETYDITSLSNSPSDWQNSVSVEIVAVASITTTTTTVPTTTTTTSVTTTTTIMLLPQRPYLPQLQ
eukprot:611320_1